MPLFIYIYFFFLLLFYYLWAAGGGYCCGFYATVLRVIFTVVAKDIEQDVTEAVIATVAEAVIAATGDKPVILMSHGPSERRKTF